MVEWIRPAVLKSLGSQRVHHSDDVLALEPSPEYTADIALRIVRSSE
jgi:hypothetical protein